MSTYTELHAAFEALQEQYSDLLDKYEELESEIIDIRATSGLYEQALSDGVADALTDLDALTEAPLKDLETAIDAIRARLRDVL